MGISLASRVTYIFVCESPLVWSAGPVRVYLGALLVWAAGLYGFSIFPGSVFGGYGTTEMVGGCVSPFIFLSLLSVLLAGGYAR